MPKKVKYPLAEGAYAPKVYLIAYPRPISYTNICRETEKTMPKVDEKRTNKVSAGVTRALNMLVPDFVEHDETDRTYFSKALPLAEHLEKLLNKKDIKLTTSEKSRLTKFLNGPFRKMINLEEMQKEDVYPLDYLRHLLGLHAQLNAAFPSQMSTFLEQYRIEEEALSLGDEDRLYLSLGSLAKKLSHLMPTYGLPEKIGMVQYSNLFASLIGCEEKYTRLIGGIFDLIETSLGPDSPKWMQLSEDILKIGVHPDLIGYFPDSLREKAKFTEPFFYSSKNGWYPILDEEGFKRALGEEIEIKRDFEEEDVCGVLDDNPESTIEDIAKELRISTENTRRALERMKNKIKCFLKDNPESTIEDINKNFRLSSEQSRGIFSRMKNEIRIEEQAENGRILKRIYLLTDNQST